MPFWGSTQFLCHVVKPALGFGRVLEPCEEIKGFFGLQVPAVVQLHRQDERQLHSSTSTRYGHTGDVRIWSPPHLHPSPNRHKNLTSRQSFWNSPMDRATRLLAIGVLHNSLPTGGGIPWRNHSTTASSGSLCCHRWSFQRSRATSSRCSLCRRGHCACRRAVRWGCGLNALSIWGRQWVNHAKPSSF
ncbi:hypothetical protein os4_38560 (plasmid) [Comamonadaceae bacterium OS-4]|nr:hypothetical protein os4_38560 [Comamonadaceae bacterium OS-4]